MKPLVAVLVLVLYASLAMAQDHDHDHGPGDGHGHEHEQAGPGGAPGGPPAPTLPPPNPEEAAALDKLAKLKSAEPKSQEEEAKLRAAYCDALGEYVLGFPESPRVPFALEAALKLSVGAGQVDKAEKLARAFLEKAKSAETKSLASRQLMQVFKFGGQPDKAVTFALEHAKANAEAPDTEWYVYEAASIEGERDRHDAAIKILEDFIAAHPKHPSRIKFKLRATDFLVSAGKAKEALPRLEAIAKEATDPEEKTLTTYFTGVALLAASRQVTGDEAAALRKQAQGVLAPLMDAARKDWRAGQPYGGMAFSTTADISLSAGDVAGAAKVYEDMAKVFKGQREAGFADRALRDVAFIGAPLEDVAGPDINGKPVKSADYKGKILLVDFFSASFGGYPGVLAQEQKLAKKLTGKPFAILGVNLDRKELADAVKKFVSTIGIDWPVIFDGTGFDGPLARSHNIGAMPANFVVDENGVVLRVSLTGPHLDDLVTQETERVAKGLPSVFKGITLPKIPNASPSPASPGSTAPSSAAPSAAAPSSTAPSSSASPSPQ